MEIFKMVGGITTEDIKIVLQGEELEELRINVMKNRTNFIDKTPIEIEVSDEGGVEFSDCITRPLPLFSDKLKSILEVNGVDNIFYKPVYLVDTLLEEKNLYWLAVIPHIECFIDENTYAIEKIGNFKIFRDVKKDDFVIYVTEELKNILEDDVNQLNGIFFYSITA